MKRLFVRQSEAIQMLGYKRSKISEVFDEIRYANPKYKGVRFKDVVFLEDFAEYVGVTTDTIEECLQNEQNIKGYLDKNRKHLTEIADHLEQTAKMVRDKLNEML